MSGLISETNSNQFLYPRLQDPIGNVADIRYHMSYLLCIYLTIVYALVVGAFYENYWIVLFVNKMCFGRQYTFTNI